MAVAVTMMLMVIAGIAASGIYIATSSPVGVFLGLIPLGAVIDEPYRRDGLIESACPGSVKGQRSATRT